MKRLFFIVIVVALLLGGAYYYSKYQAVAPLPLPFSKNPSTPQNTKNVEVIANNLEIPWSISFLPDGRLIFTQRGGKIRLLDKDMQMTDFNFEISEVKHIGEGGLLGIVVHPRFNENNFVYVYYTYSSSGGNTLNRVVRYTLTNETLENRKVIVDQIPGGTNHNGGRLKFGPDGYLYITTGDAGVPSRSQDKNSLAGKILRVDSDGKAATGNPFNNLTYSYGHRNPQGLAWNSGAELYETEHGPSARDEVNKIIKGGNFGWPDVTGDETGSGVISPVKQSGNGTWAPSGSAFYQDRLFYAGLRGTALFELVVNSENFTEHFKGEFGRIRDVVLGPDNMLYILTNNTDGRGNPQEDDDKLIRINPETL